MKQKRHTTEEIIRILREIDGGKNVDALHELAPHQPLLEGVKGGCTINSDIYGVKHGFKPTLDKARNPCFVFD